LRPSKPAETIAVADGPGSAVSGNSKFRIRPDDQTGPGTWVGAVPWANWQQNESRVSCRHQEQAVAGYLDGHAKVMRRQDINRKHTVEDGVSLTPNEMRFVLWNRQ
jgi:prepilin-type processing-associated H-X9-DG protein